MHQHATPALATPAHHRLPSPPSFDPAPDDDPVLFHRLRSDGASPMDPLDPAPVGSVGPVLRVFWLASLSD